MNRVTSPADVSMKRSKPGVGMHITMAFMCGHKGMRSGALMRGRMPWRCAHCVAAKEQK